MTNNNEQYFGKDLEAMTMAIKYNDWIFQEIKDYCKGVVYEVGAGSGTFSSKIIKNNIKELYCFEPSINIFPILNENIKEYKNVKAINRYFDNKFELKQKPDCFVYINVLEHIEKDQEEINSCYEALNGGGGISAYLFRHCRFCSAI